MHHVPPFPPRVAHGIGVALEVVNAVKHRDEETRTYLLLYAHQIRKQFPGALADRCRHALAAAGCLINHPAKKQELKVKYEVAKSAAGCAPRSLPCWAQWDCCCSSPAPTWPT